MGNQLASEVYFDELPEGYTIVQQLGKSRFLKTLQCSCVDGQLVVKAYIKNTDEDSSLIQKYQNELKAIHTQIQYYVNPNVLTFQTFDQNDKAGYMMRQYIHNNLYERMHTRPFLIDIEKLWLTYQLMKAVERCHFFGISHRDIKTENVLVTSWNWLYLTDFAPYKPTYIPEDNPANFYYFYDSCERRKCCIAPERFYTGEIPQEVEEYDLAKMDVFSLGCTIAELWIESGLFTYSELIQYKRGTYDPQSKISKISNPTIQNMVRIMIEKDKTLRPSVTHVLKDNNLFPAYFELLHGSLHDLMQHSPDQMVTKVSDNFSTFVDMFHSAPPKPDTVPSTSQQSIQDILAKLHGPNQGSPNFEPSPMQLTRDIPHTPALKLFESWSHEEVCTWLVNEGFSDIVECFRNYSLGGSELIKLLSVMKNNENVDCRCEELRRAIQNLICPLSADLSVNYDFPHSQPLIERSVPPQPQNILTSSSPSRTTPPLASSTQAPPPTPPPASPDSQHKGFTILLNLLLSFWRHIHQTAAKLQCLQLFEQMEPFVPDSVKLRIIPFLYTFLKDESNQSGITIARAIQTLSRLLSRIQQFEPTDAGLFPEYLLPLLTKFAPNGNNDQPELVMQVFAQCLPLLAEAARRFVEISFSAQNSKKKSKYTKEMDKVYNNFKNLVEQISSPGSPSSVKKALLSDIKTLCYAFGQERTNNFLLPLIISWFNEKDSELKCIFFQNFVGISTIAGTESVTSFVLTCVIPELHDTNNYVVLSALDCLTALSRLSILKTKTLLEIVEYGSPHLLNPNTAIKCTTMALMDVISKNISFTDLHCFMIPLIRPYLTRDVVDISLEALTNCLLEPIGSWSLKKAVSVVFDEVKPTTTPISLVDFQPETRISFTTQQALKQVGSIPTNPGNSHICKLQSNGFSVATEVVRIESSKRNFNGKENEELSDIRYGLKIAELDVSKEDEEKLFLIRNFIKQCSRTYHNKTTSEEADRSKKDVGWSKEELGGLKTKNVNEVDPSMLGLLTDLNLLALPPAKTPKASLRTVPTVTSPPPRGLPPITPTGTIKPRRTSEATKSKMYTPVRAVTESEDVLGSITSSFGSLIRRPANASLKSWKPAGTLVAHLSEHSGAVTCIEPSKDNLFFASGGEDGTVKIWDCQRSICTKSKCSYFSNLANDPVRALTICENTHTVACAFQSGSIHLFRIEHVLEKKDYTYDIIGRTPITEFNVNKEEGEIVDLKHYNNTQDMGPCCAPGGSLLVYVTQQGYIHGKDLRTSKEAWKLKNSNNFGLISCVHMDPSRYWMVVGTMTGYVCGWDLRFRLPFAEWKTESKYIYKICSSPIIKGTQYGLLVTGPGYFHSLDLETGQVRWLFEKKNTSENERKPSSNQRRGSNAQKELLDFTHQESSTRALLSLPDSTAVISAGTEQTITYWDFEQPDSSCIISGRQNRTAPKYSFYPRRGVMVFEEDSPKDPPQFGSSQEAAVVTTIPTKHHDTITELKYLDQPTLALISASRDGVIKVWQ